MKCISIAVLIGLPLMAACSESSPTAPVNPALELSAAASHERPFGGRCETAVTVVKFPDPANGDFLMNLHITFVCQLKHMGRTTAVSEQIVNVANGAASNTTTYTAANGDQLFATWTGGGPLNPVTGAFSFSGTETYTGGTGRFVGASGSSWNTGSGQFTGPATAIGRFTSVGTLTY